MHKTFKNSISVVFLALFISMKMLGLHVLTHDNDKDHFVHCKLCEHAMMGNHYQPALFSETSEFQDIYSQILVKAKIVDHYAFTFCDTFIANPIFSRPPPVRA